MAGRRAAEAVEAFFATHQQAVSCVTPAVLLGRAYLPDRPHLMSFGEDDGVRLGRQSALFLVVEHRYRIEASGHDPAWWTVTTAGYEYRIRVRDGRSILTYHWHPVGRSPVTYPHLHVGGRAGSFDLSKVHLPTGHVTLVDVIRLTIDELGVQALRSDWHAVLDRAERELSS